MFSITRRCTLTFLRKTFIEPRIREICNVVPFIQMRLCTYDEKKRYTYSEAQKNGLFCKDETRELMTVWPDIVKDLTDKERHSDAYEAIEWLEKVLQYNIPKGKKNQALMLVYSYNKLASKNDLTDENIRLAKILGWCIEIVCKHQMYSLEVSRNEISKKIIFRIDSSFRIMINDLQDCSITRERQKCWYLHSNNSFATINDSMFLVQVAYNMIIRYFRGKRYYLDVMETILKNIHRTTIGQSSDLLATNFRKKPNLDLFTMEKYNSIVKYKTAYYSYILPVNLAMNLAGINDPELYRQAENFLLKIGHFCQVQDDYLDCYGDLEIIDKNGTDIQLGKFSWLCVVALQHASPAQRKVLQKCYGYNDPEKIAKVKQLYIDLDLQRVYLTYEEETYKLLNTQIQRISRRLPKDIFLSLFAKIH